MKKKLICCISLIGCISIVASLLLFFSFPTIWNSCIKETHDVNDFISENYVDYNGGESAKQFFDEYANLEEYRDIAFHYCDGDKIITWYYAYSKTMFALDVWYDEEMFFEVVDTILKDTERTTLYDKNYTYDGFYEYIVTREDALYVNNYAAFYIDVKHHTIRYFFLYNVPHAPMEITDLSMYSDFTWDIPLNHNEEDWVFDYSDTTDKSVTEGEASKGIVE